jgi:hypothetical protein
VYATIEYEGPAELVGDPDTQPLGTVLCREDEDKEQLMWEPDWTFKCTGVGQVKITVKAWTDKDPFTGATLDEPLLVYSEDVIVNQVPKEIKYTIQLCKDWNYMSLPLIPPTHDVEPVLTSIMGNLVDFWTYDAMSGEWSVFIPGMSPSEYDYAGLSMLDEVKVGAGYIARMNYPDVFRYFGAEDPDPQFPGMPMEFPLAEGWNLIGVKTRDFDLVSGQLDWEDNLYAGDYLFNLETCSECGPKIVGDEARYLFTFECGYPGYWKSLHHDWDWMEWGKAYWLYASEPDLSIVPPLVKNPHIMP